MGVEGTAPQGSGGQVAAACPRPAPSTLADSHTSSWGRWNLLQGRKNLGGQEHLLAWQCRVRLRPLSEL